MLLKYTYASFAYQVSIANSSDGDSSFVPNIIKFLPD